MKKLPKEQWIIERAGDNSVVVGAYEHPPGYMAFQKFALSDLPNDLISIDDLKRLGLDVIDVPAICERHPL